MKIKHVKDRKKNLAFSIHSLVSIDKGSVSTKLFTLNEYEPCTQRRLSSGRLSGVRLKPACPATGANKSSEISRLARLVQLTIRGSGKHKQTITKLLALPGGIKNLHFQEQWG